MENYKRLKRELKYKGVILDFYADTMQLPNGKEVVWDCLEHKGAAAVVPVMSDGKICMVRQYRNAIGRETLEIPAGGLNPGETMKECAIRELEEETGYKSNQVEFLINSYSAVAYSSEKIEIYVAKNLVLAKQPLDEDEFINVVTYTVDELVEKILKGEIGDSKTVAAIMAYKVKSESEKKADMINELQV